MLLDRKANGSRPGQRTDGHHVALVVEGGGMRGVAAGGMVSALEDLGLTPCFDSVHGSSAGAAAGAYFTTGQAKLGTSLYYEDLNDSDFIDQMNIVRGKPILSTSYLVDIAMVTRKPFAFDRLIHAGVAMNVVCTDIDAATPYIVNQFDSYDYYRTALKASMSLPFIAGKEQRLDGRRLLDGGLFQQIALASAEAAGATVILALMTRGAHEIHRPRPSLKNRLEAKFLQALYGGHIGEIYFDRNNTINRQVEQIENGKTNHGVPVFAIGLPASLTYIHRLTKDANLLRQAASDAYQYTIGHFQRLSPSPIAIHQSPPFLSAASSHR